MITSLWRETKDGGTIRLSTYEAKCERVAKALMKADGWNYTGKNLMEDTAENPRAAKYWKLAEVAIAAMRGAK